MHLRNLWSRLVSSLVSHQIEIFKRFLLILGIYTKLSNAFKGWFFFLISKLVWWIVFFIWQFRIEISASNSLICKVSSTMLLLQKSFDFFSAFWPNEEDSENVSKFLPTSAGDPLLRFRSIFLGPNLDSGPCFILKPMLRHPSLRLKLFILEINAQANPQKAH